MTIPATMPRGRTSSPGTSIGRVVLAAPIILHSLSSSDPARRTSTVTLLDLVRPAAVSGSSAAQHSPNDSPFDSQELTRSFRYGGSNGNSNSNVNGYSGGGAGGYSNGGYGGGGGGFGGGDKMSNLGQGLKTQSWGKILPACLIQGYSTNNHDRSCNHAKIREVLLQRRSGG